MFSQQTDAWHLLPPIIEKQTRGGHTCVVVTRVVRVSTRRGSYTVR